MSTITGVDYAFDPHPSPAALKEYGAKFVVRYLSAIEANTTNGKNLTAPELAALRAEGLAVVLVFEGAAQAMLAGESQGVEDARVADEQVRALGMGETPVYFACDFDASPADQGQINGYLKGAAQILGSGRVGIYGGYYPVNRALTAKACTWAWQTYAWSGSHWDARSQIRQTGSAVIDGASCDVNFAEFVSYGQWPAGDPAPPASPNTALAAEWPAGLTLQFGSTGAAVTALQTLLHNSGQYGARGLEPIDAEFGTITQAAVRDYQNDKGLAVDGVAGPKTRASLFG